MKTSSSTPLPVAFFLVCFALMPAVANGLTYVMVSDETLADRADAILEVRVLDVDPSPGVGRPVTDYRMAVERVLDGGTVASPLIVRVPGGLLDNGLGLHVYGAPSFAEGQRALLFLRPQADGTYGVMHLLLGAFHLVEHEGRTLALRRLEEAEELSIPGRARPAEGPRDLERFRTWIEDRAQGTHRIADYFVDAQVDLAGALSKFTILTGSNGRRIRWRAFDTGGSANFRAHQDGQPGLAGGGFSQFQTALAVWRNDPDTPIRTNYAGTTTRTGGLTNFDNVNTILFNDPNDNDSFDAPFSCSSGGTVAVGGPWFDPSAPHVHNGETFNTAVGGDIVTNKGIDCLRNGTPWISQLRRSDEVFAHELGHTLGIGHSCGDSDSPSCSNPVLDNALMRANLHGDGRGARLQSDDRAAILFLYGSPLTPPAAPSGLTATAISSSRIDLSWNDNSNDEDSFDLERRTGGGSFQRIAQPAANVTSFRDTGRQPSTTYNYRIRARNDAGTSGFSNTATATTFGEAAPSGLAAFGVSDSQIRLFWTDNSVSESGFEIEGRAGNAPFSLLQTAAANAETADVTGLNPSTHYSFRLRAVGGLGDSAYSNTASAATFVSDPPGTCVPDATTLCLNDGRFQVRATWLDFSGQTGSGIDLGLTSTDSGLYYFFSPNNWEMLVKVLDGCAITRHFWVFAAATTNVEYTLEVTDSLTGVVKTYTNPLGVSAPAITDTAALGTCFAEVPDPGTPDAGTPDAGTPDAGSPLAAGLENKGSCVPSATRFCFNGGRYAVEVDWRDHSGNTGLGQVDPLQSADSGLMWFFNSQNLEVLVKVLDGCAINGNVWVFTAATTDVEYTLRVTDTSTGAFKEYSNPLGNPADTVTDTRAFACP